jgi:hypothetical protein
MEYQTRRSTPAELDNWYRAGHDVGIVTGAISGGLVVVDLDSYKPEYHCEGTREFTESIIAKDLGAVRASSPRGGFQYFYNHSEPVSSGTNIVPAVDIRAQGGIVILPPGNGRRWIVDPSHGVLPLPQDVLDAIVRKERVDSVTVRHRPSQGTVAIGPTAAILSGTRHDHYLARANQLWNRGHHNSAEILEELMNENARRSPDHDRADIIGIVRSLRDRVPLCPDHWVPMDPRSSRYGDYWGCPHFADRPRCRRQMKRAADA